MTRTTDLLHSMDHNEINLAALALLDKLLERCTVNLISQLTGITRVTLYRWLDVEVPLESMNVRDAAWFIMLCETSPKLKMLLARAPLTNPRLAKRLTDAMTEQTEEDDAHDA